MVDFGFIEDPTFRSIVDVRIAGLPLVILIPAALFFGFLIFKK